MKILSIVLFIGMSANAFAQSENPATFFDFWVGNWEVSWDEANGTKGKGTNLVEKTLDGTVIQENFRVLEGSQAGFKGTSISVYNPQTQTWKQAWADNQGGYFDFTGITEKNVRIFQTAERDLPDGRKIIQRMRFYNIEENSLTWDWESSFDGGQSWSLAWRIYYNSAD